MKKHFFFTSLLFTSFFFSFQVHSLELSRSCFSIKGMHCGSCKEKIEDQLKSEAAIKDYEVSLKSEIGIVSYDAAKTDDQKIIGLIKLAGYDGKKTKCLK